MGVTGGSKGNVADWEKGGDGVGRGKKRRVTRDRDREAFEKE